MNGGNMNSLEWNNVLERWNGLATRVEHWTGLLEYHAPKLVHAHKINYAETYNYTSLCYHKPRHLASGCENHT